MTNSHSKPLRIVLFTPFHEGFFYGELINHFRLLCKLKNYALDVIATHSFGQYQSEFWLSDIGAVIIIRNAISPNFAKQLCRLGIPCVSIAHDYFPAPVKLVCSNNRQGMNLAFEHLYEKGHRRIAFIGDLTQFDLRKRYEAYCEQHAHHDIPLDEALVFASQNTTYLGGFNAAYEFVQRNCNATAVIAGAGLLAEGFKAHMSDMRPHLYEELDIITFDLMPVQVLSNKSTMAIDLNLMVIAHSCITTLERMLAGNKVEHQTKVDCYLVTLPAFGQTTELNLAPCLDDASFANSPYMKSLITNMHEWSMAIAATEMNDIMSLAPLFNELLQVGILFRLPQDFATQDTCRLIKILKRQETLLLDKYDESNQCLAKDAQSHLTQHCNLQEYELTTSVPIIVNGQLWGMFTVCGNNEIGNSRNNYLALLCYLDLIVQFLTKNLAAAQDSQLSLGAANQSPQHNAVGGVSWDFAKSEVEWSDAALLLLGLSSDLERNIYRHMDLDDRVHEFDQSALREKLRELHEDCTHVSICVRIKLKNGTYKLFRIDGTSADKNQMTFELRPELNEL